MIRVNGSETKLMPMCDYIPKPLSLFFGQTATGVLVAPEKSCSPTVGLMREDVRTLSDEDTLILNGNCHWTLLSLL